MSFIGRVVALAMAFSPNVEEDENSWIDSQM